MRVFHSHAQQGKTHGERKGMNKKTAIVSVLFGILLIGIVSAGLLIFLGRLLEVLKLKLLCFIWMEANQLMIIGD